MLLCDSGTCELGTEMTRDAPERDGEWRRAALSYREKFVDDLVIALPDATGPPLRIAQAASAAAVGTASRRGDGRKDRHSVRRGAGPVVARRDDPDDDASADPIPSTGFTVWDAGILLGMYVTQPEVWRRLTRASSSSSSSSSSDAVVLELGSGTGVAGLLVASSGLPAVVGMSDLPAVVPFLRANASRNKAPEGPVPGTVAMATVPLRWGVTDDAKALPGPLRAPHVVLGADLIYTERREVIDALVTTLESIVPVGGVAVFASCVEHRPESVSYFEERVTRAGGFTCVAVDHGALRPGYGREGGGTFRVVEMTREGGEGTS